MNILRSCDTDLAAALRELSGRLSLSAGMTSADSAERTRAVFGEPLSPLAAVRRIVDDVRARGDAAVSDYTLKLDGAALRPDEFRVTPEEIACAWASTPPALRTAMERAAANLRAFQRAILVGDPPSVRNAEGAECSVRYRPLRRAACYVPGGRASYPSTVLMTAIPAQAAGVSEIVMATPCRRDGTVRPETLAAARVAGVSEVYRVGGAQAVAALAYGTAAIPKVEKIVGPGNLFVTLAKKEVYGAVDLDMLAGPSEVLVIADASADPRFVAADLLSQAEHDPAASVLLTCDDGVAERTRGEIARQAALLSRAEAARDCLERYGFLGVTRDLDEAVALANAFAPEHLELAVRDPEALLPRITAAGAVFLGPFTPEPIGDYLAGPSHVLPTGGTARFFSGLSVNDFLRRTSVIRCDREALRRSAEAVDVFARAEGLDAHARAVTIRFE